MGRVGGSKNGQNGDGEGRFKKGRMPHNAKVPTYADFGDLVRSVGAAPKSVTINGQEVSMPWSERSMRLSVDRAIKGQTRDLIDLLRLMIKHPQITGPVKTKFIYVMRGGFAGC